MGIAGRPWCPVVWERYEGPEGVVERDVDPIRVAESTSGSSLTECLEVNVLLPDRETHGSKTTKERGTKSDRAALCAAGGCQGRRAEGGSFAVH